MALRKYCAILREVSRYVMLPVRLNTAARLGNHKGKVEAREKSSTHEQTLRPVQGDVLFAKP